MKKSSEKFKIESIEDDPVISAVPGLENISVSQLHEVYKSLSEDDQAEILKRIIDDGGLNKLISVVQDITTPGAVELMLDTVEYYHFLPVVKNPGSGWKG